MRPPPFALAFVLAATTASAQPPIPDSTPRRSGVAGVIRDSLGRPLAQATVNITGRDLLTVSDDSGRFQLGGLAPGPSEIRVMRIGFRMLEFTVFLPPDSTVIVAVHLRPVHTLDQVVVTDERVSERFARTGFYGRQRMSLGTFVTPERVDSLSYVTTPAKLLRDVPGLDVRCSGECAVQSRWVGCLVLFVDGVSYGQTQLDHVLTTGVVYAIEVYNRPSVVPLEFQAKLPERGRGMNPRAGCGALVVWTRSRAR